MKRNTIQRTLILETVRSVKTHPTAEEIYDAVSGKCPGISRATVYRVLDSLAGDGEIQRINIANAPDRFDFTLSPHAHCLCESCGRVFDIGLVAFPTVSDNSGFSVKNITVTARGLCSCCAGAAALSS